MRPLRFAFLTTFYPPNNFGGDGIGIQRLARGLVRRGHHVTVVHDVDAHTMLYDGPERVPGPEPEGLEVVRLRSSRPLLSTVLTHQTGRPVVNGARIRQLLEEGDFDVVNFHNITLVGGPGLLSYGGDAVRLYMAHDHWLVCPMHVLWRHGRERCTGRQCLRCAAHHRRPPQLYRYSGFMDRKLRHVDRFIAMSEFSRDKHHEFGFDHDMTVLPYFLPDPDPDAAGPNAEAGAGLDPDVGASEGLDPEVGSAEVADAEPPWPRPYFLFVGRLEKIKGLDEVIPLFERYPDADLVIAGDGEYASVLREAAQGNPRVHFLGRVPLEELRRYYENALALIVPSVCFETFGIILIEAFSYRTPVIARRLGPFPEIVQSAGGGELFDTTDELLSCMKRIQSDPEYRRRLSASGHAAFRERWTESAVIPQYLDIVRSAAQERGRHDLVEALAHGASS